MFALDIPALNKNCAVTESVTLQMAARSVFISDFGMHGRWVRFDSFELSLTL